MGIPFRAQVPRRNVVDIPALAKDHVLKASANQGKGFFVKGVQLVLDVFSCKDVERASMSSTSSPPVQVPCFAVGRRPVLCNVRGDSSQ